MTAESISDLISSKLRRHRLAIVSTGTAFKCYRDEVTSLCDGTMTVAEFLAAGTPAVRSLVITDLEYACTPDGLATLSLGALRARVDEALEAGTAVLLASAYPKMRYPEVPGSSLLDDASTVHLPLKPSRAGEPLSCFPSWTADVKTSDWMKSLLDELGLDLISRLDEVLYESQLPPIDALNALAPNELDSLYFAGLIRPSGEAYGWASSGMLPVLKEAVASVLANSTSITSDLPTVFELLWQIERRIRAVYRQTAIDVWGDQWKEVCLASEDLKRKVLLRAGDFAYRGVKKLSVLRDPLEWLTLSELLNLRQEKAGSVGDFGIDPTLWRTFALEVLPIRNQVSHMRLTRPRDLLTLKAWANLMRKQLKATPAVKPKS